MLCKILIIMQFKDDLFMKTTVFKDFLEKFIFTQRFRRELKFFVNFFKNPSLNVFLTN